MDYYKPYKGLIDITHIFTPFALERVLFVKGNSSVHARYVYIFGIREASFNVTPF